MASGTLIWVLVGGGILLLATAAVVLWRLLRQDEDDAELPEEPLPAPVPEVHTSELRVPAMTPPPPPPPKVEEKQLFRYPGRRAGWWICPNCACENGPDRTHCRVCLWDRSVEVK